MSEKNTALLASLLVKRESEWLDFKREYHDNNASLIHDILCLANSDAELPRYLVFGVDNDKTVVGITNDRNRKNQAMVYDLLDGANFNVIPTIRLHTVHYVEGVEVDILEIENRAEKPYFLTKDRTSKTEKKEGDDARKNQKEKTVRAGAVYSRLGDRNTPIDSCVDDKKLERMFLQRFSLNLTPSERFRRYICDLDGWQKDQGFGGFYVQHPEFTLEEVVRSERYESYDELWVKIFPDSKGYRYLVNAKYFGTVLEQIYVIFCDGGRVHYAQPSLKHDEDSRYYYWYYYIIRGSHRYNLNEYFHGKPVDFRGGRQPIAELDNEEEVSRQIDAAKRGEVGPGMYLMEKESREYYYAGHDGELWKIRET